MTKTKISAVLDADIIIFKRSLSTSSDKNSFPSVIQSNVFAFHWRKNLPYAIIDFTSANLEDRLISKWTEYFEAKVQYYYIFHLKDRDSTDKARVTVGSLLPIFDGVLSPIESPVEGASSLSTPQIPGTMYYKTVYCDDDVVDIGPYAALEYTVAQLMSVSFMKAESEKMRAEDSVEGAQILKQDLINADAFNEIEYLVRSNMELEEEFKNLEHLERGVNGKAAGTTSRDSTNVFWWR